MKNFKLFLGIILWLIVITSSIYLYNFSEKKGNFASIYTRTDSTFYKDKLAEYKIQKVNHGKSYHSTQIDIGSSSTSISEIIDSLKIMQSYVILDSLKKNNLINLNSILNNLPKSTDISSIKNDKTVQIGEQTTNQKVKQLYQIWLTRIYEKAWVDETDKATQYIQPFYLERIKGDSIGLNWGRSDIPDIYLKQEIDIKEDQKIFSITTHYFGRDTLTVTKNYRITTKKGEKIKPFDYEEIK